MLNQKQEKATWHCRAELIRHCFLFHESYWYFTFFSFSLFAPQPIQHVERLITETRAAHSLSWVTQSAKFPTQPALSPAHIEARHSRCNWCCTWGPLHLDTLDMCLWAVAHQSSSGVMHCGNSDTLHHCWDPDLMEGSSVCSPETIIVMRFRKRLNIHAVKRHFQLCWLGQTHQQPLTSMFQAGSSSWAEVTVCPPLPPSRIVQPSSVFITEVRGEGVTFLWSIRQQLRSLAGCCLRWKWLGSSMARVTHPPPSYNSWCSQVSPLARLTPSSCTCARPISTYHLPQPLRSQIFR